VFFFAVLLFIAAEIAAFVLVAEHIGWFLALVLLVVTSALGPFVVRRVGFATMVHIRDRLIKGEVPTRELLDGAVIFIGGVMICVPGFLGDAIGLLLMIGPIRRLVIEVSGHRLGRRVQRFRFGRGAVIDVDTRPPSNGPAPTASKWPLGPGPSTGERS
jgi:UPF0716 protein FxsA